MRNLVRATATAALAVAAVAIPLTGSAMASTTAVAPSHSHRLLPGAHHDHGWCRDYRYNRVGHHWNRWDDCDNRWDRRGYYRSSWKYRGHDTYRYCNHRF